MTICQECEYPEDRCICQELKSKPDSWRDLPVSILRIFLGEIDDWDGIGYYETSREVIINEVINHENLDERIEYKVNEEWSNLTDEWFHVYMKWRLDELKSELNFFKKYNKF